MLSHGAHGDSLSLYRPVEAEQNKVWVIRVKELCVESSILDRNPGFTGHHCPFVEKGPSMDPRPVLSSVSDVSAEAEPPQIAARSTQTQPRKFLSLQPCKCKDPFM